MMEFSARDFIQGPYVKCPQCNGDEFGILSIGPYSYTRRCASCFFPHPRLGQQMVSFPLPALAKKIIYLDQFAISEMMKAINPETKAHQRGNLDSAWLDLFKKLGRLSKLQLVSCPDSGFHHEESLTSPHFAANKRMYEHLSHGVSFEDHDHIKLIQIHEHFSNWLAGNPSKSIDLSASRALKDEVNRWTERLLITVRTKYPQQWIDDLRAEREKIRSAMAELFFKRKQETHKAFTDWFEEEIRAFGTVAIDGFFMQVKRQREWRSGTRELTFEDLGVNLSSRIIQTLMDTMQRQGVPEDQHWLKVAEYFGSAHIEQIPYVRVNAMLWASLAREGLSGRNTPPNQGTYNDFEMISVLAPYCDAIFVDNHCAEHLSQTPLNQNLYNTRVFCKKTMAEFLEYLDGIERSMSDSHYKAVQEVYGAGWEEPFLSMYTIKDDDS